MHSYQRNLKGKVRAATGAASEVKGDNELWSEAELKRLAELVDEDGTGNWGAKARTINAEFHPDRTTVRTGNAVAHAYTRKLKTQQTSKTQCGSGAGLKLKHAPPL